MIAELNKIDINGLRTSEDAAYITKSMLKERGWTKKTIKSLYPVCDLTKPNPRYKMASPMKLYHLGKVEGIEQSEEFKKYQLESLSRKKAAMKAVDTKKDRLFAEIASWRANIRKIPLSKARTDAIEYYNHWSLFHGSDKHASLDSDQGLLDRITVNYLRHNLSNYEPGLSKLFNRVGMAEAYKTWKIKILEVIAEIYPELAHEVKRQIEDLVSPKPLEMDFVVKPKISIWR